MKSVNKLYFSETISKIHHNRIRKQLENGNTKMKKDIHVIILKEQGDNLFEYLELKDYMNSYEITNDFILIGAVTSYGEFTEFVAYIMNKCLEKGIAINKEAIVKHVLTSEEL